MSSVTMTVRLEEENNDIVETYQGILKSQKIKSGVDKNGVINRIIKEWGEDRTLINEVKKVK